MEMQKSSIPLRRRRSQLSKNPMLANMRFVKPNQDNLEAIKELNKIHKINKKHKSSQDLNEVTILIEVDITGLEVSRYDKNFWR